jgi:hypothetical protein
MEAAAIFCSAKKAKLKNAFCKNYFINLLNAKSS